MHEMTTSCTVNLRAYAWLDSNANGGSDSTSSMSCWSREEKRKIFTLTERSKVGQRSFATSKPQSFQFDDIDSSPQVIFGTASSLLRNGFNVSLWLDKTKFKPEYSQLNYVTTELLSTLISELSNETYLMNADDGIRVSWNISVNCFEVLGDYVRDLLATSSSSPPDVDIYNISPVEVVYWGLTPLRLRESENGVYLSGLQSFLHRHSDSLNSMQELITRIEEAINHRATLMESSPGYKFESIGDVGHCIIEIHLEQLIYTRQAEYIKRNSVCKLVSFADLDCLCYKPINPCSNLILMDMIQMKKIDVLLKRIVSLSEPDLQAATALQNITKQDKLELRRTIVSSSIRSLSTLTRIAKLLNSSVKQHIPYRDSILTRIFQPLLEGNFCPLLITTACGSLQSKSSTLHALRFASQLRCICNKVSRNDYILNVKSLESENILRDIFGRSSYVNIEGISHFEMIMNVDMMTQLLHMYEERLLMANADFDAIEFIGDSNNDTDNNYKSLGRVNSTKNIVGNIEGQKKRLDIYRRYSDIQKYIQGGLQEASQLLKSATFFSSLGLTLQENNEIYDSDVKKHIPMKMGASRILPSCISQESTSVPLVDSITKTHDERGGVTTSVKKSRESLDQSPQGLPRIRRNYDRHKKGTMALEKSVVTKDNDINRKKKYKKKTMACSTSFTSLLSNSPSSVAIASPTTFPKQQGDDPGKDIEKQLIGSRSSMDLVVNRDLTNDMNTVSPSGYCGDKDSRKTASVPSMTSTQEDVLPKNHGSIIIETSASAFKGKKCGVDKLPLLSSGNRSCDNRKISEFEGKGCLKGRPRHLQTLERENKDYDEVDGSIEEEPIVTPRTEARKRLFAALWTQDSSSRGLGITASFSGTVGKRRPKVMERQVEGEEEYGQCQEEEEEEEDYSECLSKDEEQFLRAVTRNQIEEVEAYLLSGVDVHTKNSFGRDGMQISSRNGYVRMMEVLASWGGSYLTVGPNQDTLLHIAVFNRQCKALRCLVDLNIIDVNGKDIRGQTIAHIAARRCEIKILEYIVENVEIWKIDFALKDYSGQTPYTCIPRLSARPNAKTRRFFETRILPLLPSERPVQREPLVNIRDLFASITDLDGAILEEASGNKTTSLARVSQ